MHAIISKLLVVLLTLSKFLKNSLTIGVTSNLTVAEKESTFSKYS